MMYIKRHLSTVINSAKNHFPALLITGARQVGKSTLLRNTLEIADNYFTLDDFILLEKAKTDPIGFIRELHTPLILDEIQYCPDIFRSIKLVIDENRKNGMYFLTGSQAFHLMKNLSESLAGRVGIFNLYGLSNREISGDSFDKPFLPTEEYLHNRSPVAESNHEILWNNIHRGSMPELYRNPEILPRDFYSSYLRTYIERDVRELSQIGNELAYMQFITALASRTGELLNIASISRDVGVSQPTIKKWISILETSNIIYLLQPFSRNITTRSVKTPKVYFTDTGLVCYLCKWNTPEQLKNGAQAGNIFETYVFNEIIKSIVNSGNEPSLYFYRDSNGKEVDLLFYENGTLYPVEIKKTSTPRKNDINSFKILESAFPTMKIGEGGLICSYDKLIAIDTKNRIIPLKYV